MKKFAFCILLFWIWNFSFAQSSLKKNTADSLWNVWTDTSQTDLSRLNAIQNFTWNGYVRSLPDSAIYYATLQLDFAQQRGIRSHQGNALNSIGAAYDNKGDNEKAIDYYLKVLEIKMELNDEQGVGKVYNNISLVYYGQSLHEEAIEYGLKSLAISQKTGDFSGIALAYNNLGNTYRSIGDIITATNYYHKSLAIRVDMGDKRGSATVYNNIALIHFHEGDFTKAYEYYMLSLNLKIELNDSRGIATTYNNLGVLYSNLGDKNSALDYYLRALKIREDIGDKKGVGLTLNNIGSIYYDFDNFVLCNEFYLKSLLIRKEINDKIGHATVLNNIGLLKIAEKQHELALEYYQESLKIRVEIDDKSGIAVSYLNIGLLYGDYFRNYDSAFYYCKKSLELSQQVSYDEDIRKALKELYLYSVIIENFELASQYLSVFIQRRNNNLKTNFFGLSEYEKQNYFNTMEKDYYLYHDFTSHYSQNCSALADTAYNLLLQTKSITLKSTTVLRKVILNSNDSKLIENYESWILLKKKIAKDFESGKDTKSLELEAEIIERNLIRSSGAFAEFSQIQNLDWKQVRNGLREGEAAIEFVHYISEIDTTNPIIYAAYVVRPESEHPDVIKLCTEENLKNILGVFQGNNLSFIEKVYGKKTEAKKDLYEKIWQPLEPFLQDVKTVYYSPSGLLHKVSFSSICKAQDVYLSDVYNFRQMGSTGNLAFENKTEFGELENFLLMGGVQYNSDSTEKKIWDYLPGSLSETNAINNYLQKKKFGVNYFKEGNASEAIFKEKIVSSSIVHIATHGFFFPDPEQVSEEMKANSESNQDLKFRGTTNYANWSFVNNKNPLMRSGIVLAGANDVWQRDALAEGEDGILTAQEVSNLDLRNTKLVVLSACETGLGDIKGSEGVFGLQRAFKMAGVKYLIMSLWQVPDKETSEFMILFYKNLLKIRDIPLAFQKTQKVMREKYDPYYWGAFVLIE